MTLPESLSSGNSCLCAFSIHIQLCYSLVSGNLGHRTSTQREILPWQCEGGTVWARDDNKFSEMESRKTKAETSFNRDALKKHVKKWNI